MRETSRLPGWFIALFTAAMLALCGIIAFCAVEQVSLRFQVDDLTLSLDTSRQREKKQQFEYDEVVAALPVVQAELDATQPLADAAVAAVTEKKATRKRLREENALLQEQLDAALEEIAALEAQLAPQP